MLILSCNTTNFNSRILCVPYRILSKTNSLVSMKCHCTATVDNVHAETLQVYLLTKIIHVPYQNQTLYLPYMTPTQGSRSTTNWSQFVISQTFLIVYVIPACVCLWVPRPFQSAYIHVYILYFTVGNIYMYTPLTSVYAQEMVGRLQSMFLMFSPEFWQL